MSTKTVYFLWGILFVLCAGLGFLQPAEGILKITLFLISLLFFLPPAFLLRKGSCQDRLLIRNLSALSLGLTLVLLVTSLLTAFRSETLGSILHSILTIVSSPMVCSGCWVVSLFLWACLLTGSIKRK